MERACSSVLLIVKQQLLGKAFWWCTKKSAGSMHSRGLWMCIKWNWTEGSLFNMCHVGVCFPRKYVSRGKSEGSLGSIPEQGGDSWEKGAQLSSKLRTMPSTQHTTGVCMLGNSSWSLWGQGSKPRGLAVFIVHCPQPKQETLSVPNCSSGLIYSEGLRLGA